MLNKRKNHKLFLEHFDPNYWPNTGSFSLSWAISFLNKMNILTKRKNWQIFEQLNQLIKKLFGTKASSFPNMSRNKTYYSKIKNITTS